MPRLHAPISLTSALDATERAPIFVTDSATSRSVDTTTTGRPVGSTLTSWRIAVGVHKHPVFNCVRITCGWQGWFDAFPQIGPGRKHKRAISLEAWQQQIVDNHPWAFLRGLLHSDGCRSINRFKTRLPSGRVAEYSYPRYFFTNHSADIRRIFCAHCELLGVRWTQSNARNISVSHRDSVALLDTFIGPKS